MALISLSVSLFFVLGRADLSDFRKLMSQGADAVDDWFTDLNNGVHEIARTVQEWEAKFDDFLTEHGVDLTNDSKTREERQTIFQANVEEIESANAAALKNGDPAPLRQNHLTHLSVDELLKGANPTPEEDQLTHEDVRRLDAEFEERRRRESTKDSQGHYAQDPPTNWSWRDRTGALRSVKHQTCNNCWAHAAVDAMENRNWVKNGISTDLSINMVADCVYNYVQTANKAVNDGCEPGWEWKPFQLGANPGIMTMSDYMSDQYPAWKSYYETHTTSQCADPAACTENESRQLAMATIFGDAQSSGQTCRIALSPLANPGARTITGADTFFNVISFAQLKFEIFNHGSCVLGFGSNNGNIPFQHNAATMIFAPGARLDHAVSVVGYGYDGATPYMICKNSWGTSWGDGGYFKVKATDEYFGTGAKAGRIRVHCPRMEANDVTETCTDGGLSNDQGTQLVPVRFSPAENMRTYSGTYGNNNPGGPYAKSGLDSSQGWSYSYGDISNGQAYMIMDMGKQVEMAGVVTQGSIQSHYGHDPQWVTSYQVDVSNDKNSWSPAYNILGGGSTGAPWDNVYFPGNFDQDTMQYNMFGSPASGNEFAGAEIIYRNFRYIRLTVMGYHGWPSMRAGVFFYEKRGCWCAGSYCSKGTVCSHIEGACIAPGGDASDTKTVDTFGNHDHTLGDEEVKAGEGSGDSSAFWLDVDWDLVGPISVLVSGVIVGVCVGAIVISFCRSFCCCRLCNKRKSGSSPQPAIELATNQLRPRQWNSGAVSPHSPGTAAKNDSHFVEVSSK